MFYSAEGIFTDNTKVMENFSDTKNIFKLNDNTNWGFIILRHVSNENHNKLWVENYKCIRKLYKDRKIVIIDDNSNYKFVSKIDLHNTIVINSEFKKRGEFLPYYYYSKNKWFDCAIIVHDGFFVNKKVNYEIEDYVTLLEFDPSKNDHPEDETKLIKSLKDNKELYNFYNNKNLWKGCFGCMTIITHNYIKKIDDRHELKRLINGIQSRYNRMSFERVLSCLLHFNNKNSKLKRSLLGNIYKYTEWGKDYNHYTKNLKGKSDKPFLKVWSGR